MAQQTDSMDTVTVIDDTAVRPFTVDVPQVAIDDLRRRLDATRWPSKELDPSQGVQLELLQALARYWSKEYDFGRLASRLNAVPQFMTTIDGVDVHFIHVRSKHENALPLILTHGWPGSVVEMLDVIGPLTDPTAHGGTADDAFDLVIPSLPGYGFSGPTREAGWNNDRIARAWAELMRRLGYQRYGAVGNDAGSMISPEVGRIDPQHVVGVHVTQIFSFPSGDPAEMADLSEEEQTELQTLQWFYENKFSFNTLMAQQPQTLAFAVNDSPVGLLAWNGQLLGADLEPDFALSNVMTYWLTGTAASAARLYYENAHAARPTEPTTIPLALAGFGGDFSGIRRFAERDHKNIVRWSMFDHGGHFAAHKAPDLWTGDVREFFRDRR